MVDWKIFPVLPYKGCINKLWKGWKIMSKHVNIAKGHGELENIVLNAKIDKLNFKWEIIAGMVEDADFVENFYDCKKVTEKEKIRKAKKEFTRLERIGYIDRIMG